ncbi:MAG: YbhN family protein [Candidatus Binatia bacterium]
MAQRRPLWSSPWVKLAVSALLLGALLWGTDWRDMRAALATADLRWVLLAWAIYCVAQLVSGYRWWLLTRAVGFDEPPLRIIAYYFAGMYLNLFGPGTVTGDVGRALLLGAGDRRALALTTVLAHRSIGFVALVWVSSAGLLLAWDLPVPVALRGLAALAVPTTLIAWLAGPRLAARLLPPTHRWRLLIERSLAPYWHDRRLLMASLFFAAAVHALQIGCQVAVGRAVGVHPPLTFFWVVTPLANAASMLPFSLNGFGVREAAYWITLGQLGVGTAPAIAVGLLTSAIVLANGLLGLPCFAVLRRKR